MKGDEVKPIAQDKDQDAEFSKEEQEMYDMMRADVKTEADIISHAADKYELEYDKNQIPIIKIKKTFQKGWVERYKVL